MKTIVGIVAVIALSFGIPWGVSYAVADGSGSATPGAPTLATPAPDAPVVTPPADKLHDPVAAPAAAFDDVRAAKSVGWAAAVFAVLVMLARLLGRVQRYSFLAWLGKGRTAVVVAGTGAIAAAVYNVAMEGGSWMALLFAAVLAGATFWNSQPADKT